jgi:hypothetical protein
MMRFGHLIIARRRCWRSCKARRLSGKVETGYIRPEAHGASADDHIPLTTSKVLSVHVDEPDPSQRVH